MKNLNHPFVILTSPRSGSTWLVSLLNQVDGIAAFGELFLPRARGENQNRWDADFAYPRFVEGNQKLAKLRPLAVFSYLDELYRRPGAVGFKLMYSQMRLFPELLAYFVVHNVRVIHLIRRNPLDQLISLAVKNKLEKAHRMVDQETEAERVQVELNTKTLVNKLQDRQQMNNKNHRLLRLTRLPLLEVAYEDLQKKPDTFPKICAFLSTPYSGEVPESRFVKIRRESQAEVLTNYEEVRETLVETPYKVFLE